MHFLASCFLFLEIVKSGYLLVRMIFLNAFLFIKPSSADLGLIQLIIYFPFEGAGEMYYYVVFNGFHVTEQKITSYSKNDKVRFYTLFFKLFIICYLDRLVSLQNYVSIKVLTKSSYQVKLPP